MLAFNDTMLSPDNAQRPSMPPPPRGNTAWPLIATIAISIAMHAALATMVEAPAIFAPRSEASSKTEKASRTHAVPHRVDLVARPRSVVPQATPSQPVRTAAQQQKLVKPPKPRPPAPPKPVDHGHTTSHRTEQVRQEVLNDQPAQKLTASNTEADQATSNDPNSAPSGNGISADTSKKSGMDEPTTTTPADRCWKRISAELAQRAVAKLPRRLRRRRLQGIVQLSFELTADGSATSAEAEIEAGPELLSRITLRLLQQPFAQPCDGRRTVRVRFIGR